MIYLLFILAPFWVLFRPNYDNIFTDGHKDAMAYLYAHKEVISRMFDEDEKEEQELVLSIVFPELMRHVYLIDFFQERAMSVIYVNHGTDKADFSIGRFQIKPSFVEKIEKYVSESPPLQREFAEIIHFKSDDPVAIRSERIARLGKIEWKLLYMRCFLAIMNERLENVSWKNNRHKIRILSTAYNHNFLADYETLNQWSKKKLFPYGMETSQKQYAYAHISIYFSERIWPGVKDDFSPGLVAHR